MADANTAAETVKLLTDIDTSNPTGQTIENLRRLNELEATSQRLSDLQTSLPKPLTQAQLLKQQEEALAAQQEAASIERSASDTINNAYNRLNLSAEEGRLVRLEGALDPVLNHILDQERARITERANRAEKPETLNRQVQILERAQELLRQDGQAFGQENGINLEQLAGQNGFNDPEKIADLATPDGVGGFLKKTLAAGAGGIAGLGGLLASGIGLERTGQSLGGLNQNIREAAGTDIGSLATSLEGREISNDPNASAFERGLSQVGRVFTDADAAGDVAADLFGAVGAGGPVGAAGRGAGRAIGRAVGREGAQEAVQETAEQAATRQATEAANARVAATRTEIPSVPTPAPRPGIIDSTGRAAPAVFVGAGQGVDENLTPGEARLRLATAGASSVLAGAGSSLFGASTAEQAIGNVIGRGAAGQGTVGTLRGGVARGAGGSTVAEGAQGFVEGTGEELGLINQRLSQQQERNVGALETLTSENIGQAIQSGIENAPLEAAIGGVAGAPSGIANTRARNQEVQQAGQRQNVIDAQRAEAVVEGEQRVTAEEIVRDEAITQDAQRDIAPGLAEETVAFNEAQGPAAEFAEVNPRVEARQLELNQQLTQRLTESGELPQPSFDSNAPALQAINNEAPQVKASFVNTLNPSLVLNPPVSSDPAAAQVDQANRNRSFITNFADLASDPVSVRALYRNEVSEAPEIYGLGAENQFVSDIAALNTALNQGTLSIQDVAQGTRDALARAETTTADINNQRLSQPVTEQQQATETARQTDVATQQVEAEAEAAIAGQELSDTISTGVDASATASSESEAANRAFNIQQADNLVGDTFRQPEPVDPLAVSVEEGRTSVAPSASLENTLLDRTPDEDGNSPAAESFGKLFLDTNTDRDVRENALAGLVLRSNPNLNANQADSIAADTFATVESNPGQISYPQVVSALRSAINRVSTNPEPDPDPPPPTPQGFTENAATNPDIAEGVSSTRAFDENGAITPSTQTTLDSLFQERSPLKADIQRELNTKGPVDDGFGKSVTANAFRKAVTRARNAANSGGDLSTNQRNAIQRLVNIANAVDNRKKPEGDSGSPTNTTRSSRVLTPPSQVRSTQGPVGVGRFPVSAGLLPRADTISQPQRFSTQDVESSIQDITKDWSRKLKGYTIVESNADLPVRPADGGLVAGLTDGKDIYIVADQINSASQLQDVLLEEITHRGFRNSLGGNYDPIVSGIYRQRGGVDGILALGRKYGIRPDFETTYNETIVAAQEGNTDAQIELTDEVLSQIGSRPDLPKPIQGVIKRIANKLRKYFKQFFSKDSTALDFMSDADLLQMVREATTAGREPGSFEGPIAVRASRARVGERTGVDAQGRKVLVNRVTGEQRPDQAAILDAQQATTQFARNQWDNVRNNSLGESLFQSRAWAAIQKRVHDSGFLLKKMEIAFRKLTGVEIGKIFDDIRNSDEVKNSPLLQSLLTADATRQSDLLSPDTARTAMAARAEFMAKNEGPGKVAVDSKGSTMHQKVARMNDAYQTYADVVGVSAERAKTDISDYMTSLHTDERIETAWLTGVNLTDAKARQERDGILERGMDVPGITRLREINAEFAEVTLAEYEVGTGKTRAQAAETIANMEAIPGAKKVLQQAAQATYDVIEASNFVRKETGSFSNSLQNAIDAYGWKNYVPLKGKGIDLDENDSEYSNAYANDILNTTFRPFEGRESQVEDVFENVLRAASGAMEERASQEYKRSIAVNVLGANNSTTYQQSFEADGNGGKLLAGKIEELDINSGKFKSGSKLKDRNRIVLYGPNQKAVVITLSNDAGADAVLGARSQTADTINNFLRKTATVQGRGVADITQFLSSLKTWRNPAFIPFDGLRNQLTLGYIIASEEGGQAYKNYVSQFARRGLMNYSKDIGKFVSLYGTGQFSKLATEVNNAGDGSVMAQMQEFFALGGPTSQVAALRDADFTDLSAMGDVSGAGAVGNTRSKLRKMNEYFSVANATMDALSRFAFYRALVDQGIPPAQAAARAKNTANFESKGTWSGPMSALFEFARATAVGSSALINSTLTGRYGKETAAATFGVGVGLYVMATLIAGVDEETGEDLMADVNGKLFTTNFVGIVPGTDQRLQFGLGHGPMAWMMSTGIQFARQVMGHQSMEDTLENSLAGVQSLVNLVPTTGISPTDDPAGFIGSSVTPGFLRPWFEVERNMTSYGLPVSSDFAGAFSGDLTDSFQGRYNSEGEMYDQVTSYLSDQGLAEMNPDNLRHIMRSYGGVMTHVTESMFEIVKALSSDEEYAYNLKAMLYPFRNFIGSDFSQKSADYYRHRNRVLDLDARAKAFEKAGRLDEAETIRETPFYQDNIDNAKAAKKRDDEINREYGPELRLRTGPTADTPGARNRREDRDEARSINRDNYLSLAVD